MKMKKSKNIPILKVVPAFQRFLAHFLITQGFSDLTHELFLNLLNFEDLSDMLA
jgi:hypothetical protein